MHKHNNPAETAVAVYHGHNGDRGKVKGLKDNLPFATCASLSRGVGGS